MNLAANQAGTAADLESVDELLVWELRVAKRADELAKKTEHGRDRDLENWLQAEREIFDSPRNRRRLFPDDRSASGRYAGGVAGL